MLMITIGGADHPSSRVRAIQFIPLFETISNYVVKWVPRIPKKPKTKFQRWLFFPIQKRALSLKRTYELLFKKWDVIFIQKIFISNWILKRIKTKGTIIIFDFDDAIHLNQKDNKTNELRTLQMIKAASKVIVGTNHLVPFCKTNGINPIVITSAVDTERIKPKKKPEENTVTIGWIGSHSTSKFLNSIHEVLLKLAKKYKFRLLIIGAEPGFKLEGLHVKSEKWSLVEEDSLLNKMDIGIMPLPETEYAKGKGGFKLFLYMAAGKPVVASAVGINNEIVKNEINGYLVKTKDEWEIHLSKLITDKVLRERMGQKGREISEEKYSLQVCYKKLISIIE